MRISGVSVTGGYLDGLTASLSPGLNVVIGGRGVGKTAFLELIKFGLGLSSQLDDPKYRRIILGDGEVAVKVVDERHGGTFIAGSGGPSSFEGNRQATPIGQGELSRIIATASSRLSLLDRAAGIGLEAGESHHPALLRLTRRASELRREIEDLQLQIARYSDTIAQIELLDQELRTALRPASTVVEKQAARLQDFDARLQALRSQANQYRSFHRNMRDIEQDHAAYMARLRSAIRELTGDIYHGSTVNLSVVRLTEKTQELDGAMQQVMAQIHQAIKTIETESDRLRDAAAPLRSKWEQHQKGVAELTLRRRQLVADRAEEEQARQVLRMKVAELEAAKAERASLIARTETKNQELLTSRQEASRDINEVLNGEVSIHVASGADTQDYERLLSDRLQGSSVRQAAVREVVLSILPTRLADIVESRDTDALRSLAAISDSAAEKIMAYLDYPETVASLFSMQSPDVVSIEANISGVRKSIEDMSDGQRAATALPILLTDTGRILILDQPEDHLDTSYIVDRVVRGLHRRTRAGAQSIIVTHNANIPVLGEAENVIVLEGGGLRGGIHLSGAWDESRIVDYVQRLMEGGRQAFHRRAIAYGAIGPIH